MPSEREASRARLAPERSAVSPSARGSATPLGGAAFHPFADHRRIEIEGGEDGSEGGIPALQEREEQVLAADVVVTQTRGLGPRGGDNIGQSGLASSISMIGMPSSTA